METEPMLNSDSFRITVEPILFSFVFTGAFSDGVITNLLVRQACWFGEGLPLDKCEDEDLAQAQKTVSYIEIYKMLIETVWPALLSLFIGPWSDSNGRRIILIVPLVGHIITYCVWATLSLFKDLNPTYLLFSCFGVALCGGFITVYIACFCYLADVTTERNRVFRMAIAEAAINIGQLTGFLLSPYAFRAVSDGYWLVFIVNAVILFLNVVYILNFIPETIVTDPDQRKKLFRISHLRDIYRTVMKIRPNYGRALILLSCFISFLSLVTIFGESAVKFLSVMKQFRWEIEEFTLYNSIILGIVFISSSVGIWIGSTLLKMSTQIMLLGSLLTRVFSAILMGISSTSDFFYFATILGSLKSFTGPLVRSQLSQIISQNDIGKGFSFLSSIESLTPQMAVPIYGAIYASLVQSFPMAIYFVSAGFLILAAITVCITMILKKLASERAFEVPPEEESI